jgi:hypothetical protein
VKIVSLGTRFELSVHDTGLRGIVEVEQKSPEPGIRQQTMAGTLIIGNIVLNAQPTGRIASRISGAWDVATRDSIVTFECPQGAAASRGSPTREPAAVPYAPRLLFTTL